MNSQIVEVHPRELVFAFEVKKQSCCTVHLANVTDYYVAFKAQKSAPLDLQCKDKFLVQTTVVAFGTTEEEITPGMFSKDGQKHIEETKLRVSLTTAFNSPSKPPADIILNQETSHEASSPKKPHASVLLPVNGVNKQVPSYEMPMANDKLQNGIENFPPDKLIKKMEVITNNVNSTEESRSYMVMENNTKPVSLKGDELYHGKDEEPKHQVKDVEEANLKLAQDIEELRSKINSMDTKLVEAQHMIDKLKEEKSSIIDEKEALKRELGMVRATSGGRKVQVGFPPLFVCFVAVISLMAGFWFRA